MQRSIPAIRESTQTTSVTPAGGGAANRALSYGFVALVLLGVIVRILIAALPGDALRTPWGGGGDTPAYVLLAHNLVDGKGYTYAGLPTAYRPPAYPFLLAGAMEVFGAHAIAAVRWLQLLAGLLTVYLCSVVASMIFGKIAGRAALVVALFFPTLILMNGEILTESLATMTCAIFLYLLVRFFIEPSWAILSGLAAMVGLATLVRANMALFGFVVLWAVIFWKIPMPKWKAVALTVFLPGLVISPWLIRNYVAFHGAFVLSTASGPTAAMGVLAPQGRAQPGDSERLIAALAWLPPMQLETNDASRLGLADEETLNQRAWHVTFHLWRQEGWRLVPLNIEKLGYFWLSTDQLLSTDSFRAIVRVARSVGVVCYWALLALGIAGWFKLRDAKPALAYISLYYAVVVTILHLPFNMNTRLRMPFIDPWLAVLAGAGLLFAAERMGFPFTGGGEER